MPAIPPHSTATSDKSWDGPAAKANLKNDGDEAYYRSAFAWEESGGDKKTKGDYKFIHHEVSGDGKVGAANLTACSSGIAVLNGGRGGADIPDGDRKGVWSHLARHLKDGGKEAPELKSESEMEDDAEVPHYGRILMAISDRPWAITPMALSAILQVVQHPIHSEEGLVALAARMGRPLQNGGNRVRDYNGTAVLDVEGPLFRYANVMTRVSGATSIQQLSLDLRAAMDDPSIKRVVLSVNSPGGQVDGINEMADMIREYGAEKPITAYVGGLAGSGGYWLAAAAGRIVTNESAQLGSIGVLATFIDNREAQRRQGIAQYDVISSQSPLKRSDPATDEGRQQMQEMVDAMADLFIGRVASFRNVTSDKVARDFGRGGILPARKAIAAGMADSLGSLEGILRERQAESTIPQQVPAGEPPAKPGTPVRRRQIGEDRPATDPPLAVPPPAGAPGPAAPAPAAQLDPQELEEGTEDSTVNDQHDCTCPEGEPCQCGGRKDEEDEEDEDENDSEDDRNQEEEDMPAKEERQRIAAIMNCEEAQGREDLARALALETNHDVKTAKALLTAAPKAGSLKMRMGQVVNPAVGTGIATEADESPAAEVQRILAFVPNERKHASARVAERR